MKKILIWLLSKLIDNNQQNEENGKKKERKKKERKKKERNSIDPRRIKYRHGQRGNKIIFACAVWIILFLIFLPLGIFFLGFFYGSLISYAEWMNKILEDENMWSYWNKLGTYVKEGSLGKYNDYVVLK